MSRLDNLLSRVDKVKQIKPGRYAECCPVDAERNLSRIQLAVVAAGLDQGRAQPMMSKLLADEVIQ